MHLTSRWNWILRCVPGLLASTPALANTAVPDAPAPPSESTGISQLVQFALDSGESFGWSRVAGNLALATVLALLLLWPIARMIIGPDKVLRNTAFFVANVVALSAAFLSLAYLVSRLDSVMLLIGVGVVFLAMLIAYARYVFEATPEEAAGILGAYLLLTVAASFGSELLIGRMPWTEFITKSKEEQSRVWSDWRNRKQGAPSSASAATGGSSVAPSTDPTPSPAAPATPSAPPPGSLDLHALYIQLEKARAELDPNDAEAVARFNQQAAAYNQEKALVAAAARRAQAARNTAVESAANDAATQSPKTARAGRN